MAFWRQLRDAGELAGLTPKGRGRKAVELVSRARKMIEQQRRIGWLTAGAERAEALVDLQKEVASLLGTPFRDDEP